MVVAGKRDVSKELTTSGLQLMPPYHADDPPAIPVPGASSRHGTSRERRDLRRRILSHACTCPARACAASRNRPPLARPGHDRKPVSIRPARAEARGREREGRGQAARVRARARPDRRPPGPPGQGGAEQTAGHPHTYECCLIFRIANY